MAKKAGLSGLGICWSAPRGGKARGLLASNTVFNRISKLAVLLALRPCTEARFVPLVHGFCAGSQVGLEAHIIPLTVALDAICVLKGCVSSPVRPDTRNRAVGLSKTS